MLSQVLGWMRSPAIQWPLLTILGSLFAWGLATRIRQGRWWSLLPYTLGGGFLVYYEFHMSWWWLVAGVASLVWGMKGSDRDSRTEGNRAALERDA